MPHRYGTNHHNQDLIDSNEIFTAHKPTLIHFYDVTTPSGVTYRNFIIQTSSDIFPQFKRSKRSSSDCQKSSHSYLPTSTFKQSTPSWFAHTENSLLLPSSKTTSKQSQSGSNRWLIPNQKTRIKLKMTTKQTTRGTAWLAHLPAPSTLLQRVPMCLCDLLLNRRLFSIVGQSIKHNRKCLAKSHVQRTDEPAYIAYRSRRIPSNQDHHEVDRQIAWWIYRNQSRSQVYPGPFLSILSQIHKLPLRHNYPR